MINKIGKITLYVDDQEEAKKFWVEKLGFVVKLEQEMGSGMKWLEVAPNDNAFTTFILYKKSLMKEQNPSTKVEHPSVILSSTDVESAYNKMKENNVKVGELQIMPYGKMFTFNDQDENSYLLREDK